jgi:hypothetical protein
MRRPQTRTQAGLLSRMAADQGGAFQTRHRGIMATWLRQAARVAVKRRAEASGVP